MEKGHGSQDPPRVPLPWWNPTSGRVLQREPAPSAPGGRAPPRYRSSGWCRGRLSSLPRPTSLRGLGSGCLNLIRVYSCDSWKKSGFLRGGPTNHTNDSRMPKKRGQSVASLEGATHASAVVEPDLRAGFAARACTKRARRSRSTSIPFIRFATWQAQSLPRPTSLHGLGSRGLSLLPMILLGR